MTGEDWTLSNDRKCFAYVSERGKPRVLEIPCQSCGKIVRVPTMDGTYVGCIFCEDCMNGHDTYQYREQY